MTDRILGWIVRHQTNLPETATTIIATLLSHVGHNHTGHGI